MSARPARVSKVHEPSRRPKETASDSARRFVLSAATWATNDSAASFVATVISALCAPWSRAHVVAAVVGFALLNVRALSWDRAQRVLRGSIEQRATGDQRNLSMWRVYQERHGSRRSVLAWRALYVLAIVNWLEPGFVFEALSPYVMLAFFAIFLTLQASVLIADGRTLIAWRQIERSGSVSDRRTIRHSDEPVVGPDRVRSHRSHLRTTMAAGRISHKMVEAPLRRRMNRVASAAARARALRSGGWAVFVTVGSLAATVVGAFDGSGGGKRDLFACIGFWLLTHRGLNWSSAESALRKSIARQADSDPLDRSMWRLFRERVRARRIRLLSLAAAVSTAANWLRPGLVFDASSPYILPAFFAGIWTLQALLVILDTRTLTAMHRLDRSAGDEIDRRYRQPG